MINLPGSIILNTVYIDFNCEKMPSLITVVTLCVLAQLDAAR